MINRMLPRRSSSAKPSSAHLGGPLGSEKAASFDWKRLFFIALGLGLFLGVWLSPPWSPATDPEGKSFLLSPQGKAALALFLLAATWWVTEVIPIGITAITIGVVQALFGIRPARVAFTDFMDPSVWFIFGSLTIGMVFTKTGFTRRLAYKMLSVVGERTSMIYLGCFVMTSALTLVMAHTAVAATVYPLFLAVYGLYREDGRPTRFGKGLFIGMAFVAGAGSIITLLGAARGAVAVGFYQEITGNTVTFFELTYYMFPLGVLMTILLWGFVMVWYKPEHKTIPGLRKRVEKLYTDLGPISREEIITVLIVVAVIVVLSLRSFFPELSFLNKSAIILLATILFFLLKIVSLEDLEGTPWNIVLLFGGAMSIGHCLWQTGAAEWLAVLWLRMFDNAPWFVFIMGIAFFVMIMTNLIMNVAAIAIVLPVALKMAEYVHVAPEVILFSSLATAGMPFLLLVGAAPNAIAYRSNMFTTKEFFMAGLPASALLMVVLGLFVWLIWPMMGMPIFVE
jgi:solute carrier family 13 (sodium-dependent dicarboxylate transporter), member 2/3/5